MICVKALLMEIRTENNIIEKYKVALGVLFHTHTHTHAACIVHTFVRISESFRMLETFQIINFLTLLLLLYIKLFNIILRFSDKLLNYNDAMCQSRLFKK